MTARVMDNFGLSKLYIVNPRDGWPSKIAENSAKHGKNIIKKAKIFNSLNEAYSYFSKNISNNDLLMIKGSNATGLNKFSKNIKKDQTNAL